MIVLHEKEMKDYIQEKYNPVAMPVIKYCLLKANYDYMQRKFVVEKGQTYKLGVYICPRDAQKLNVFFPGVKTHYTVPGDLFFSFNSPYDLKHKLEKMKSVVAFNIKGQEYSRCRNFSGDHQFVRTNYLDHGYMLAWAAKKHKIDADTLTAVVRIYGCESNSSIFWEFSYIGIDLKKKCFFFKLFSEQFLTQTYYPITDVVTVGANQKQMRWRGTSLRYTKRKLIIGQ